MFQLLATLLTGPVARAAMEALRAARQGKLSEEQARAEVEKAVAAAIERVAAGELAARRNVLTAELGGESRLQRLWRPVVALTAFFSYWFVIVAYPFLRAWDLLPDVRFGETGLQNMFWLTTVAVGGYIGGRTLEKVARLRR